MMALNTLQINKIAHQNDAIQTFFIGTFPSCKVKFPSNRKTYSFVTNTDICSKTGTHWNGWFVREDVIFFFDSFGRSPEDASFPHQYRDILSRFRQFRFSARALQPLKSFTCGYYTLHFLYLMSFGLDFSSLYKDYSINKQKNDVIVLKIIDSLL